MQLEINGYKNDEIYGNHDVPTTYAEQRALLLAIEARIKEICADELPTNLMLQVGRKALAEQAEVEDLLSWRIAVLNGMKRNEKEEQLAFDQMRERLAEMKERLIEECCLLHSQLSHYIDREPPFDSRYIEGVMSYVPATDMPKDSGFDRYSILAQPFDDYYGSDFTYIICLIGKLQMEEVYTARLCHLCASLGLSEEDFRKELCADAVDPMESLQLYFSDLDIMHLNRFTVEASVHSCGMTDRFCNTRYETDIPSLNEFFEEEAEAFDYSKHVTHNREEVAASKECGCASCCDIFPAEEVTDYTDKGTTAICPHCGVDSVIGDACLEEGIYKGFLRALNKKWF